jgi:outer membrane biosynthesis protein TonB
MSRTLVRAAALAAYLALGAGCRKPSSVTADVPTAASASSDPSTAAPARTAGPAPATASRADRESAVVDLVLGGAATSLPELSTDPSKEFDHDLRDKIAPKKKPASVSQAKLDVVGELPPEVVRRIVRQQFGRLRVCYEKALEAKPELTGTVVVAFTIDKDGSVKNAKDAGSTIGDPAMIDCAVRAHTVLTFPSPGKNTVQVTSGVELKPPT